MISKIIPYNLKLKFVCLKISYGFILVSIIINVLPVSNENQNKTGWEQKRVSDIPTRSARPQRPALCASPFSRARAVNGAADHGRVITHFSPTKYPSEPTFSLTTVPRYLDYDGAHGFVRRALSFAEGKSRKFVRSFTERSTRRSARRISSSEWRIFRRETRETRDGDAQL